MRIVVTGSLAFDQIMNFPGKFRDHILPDKLHVLNVSFSVTTLRKEYGGTGGNVAYNLALLGLKPRLVAALGRENSEYKDRLKHVGVDVARVRLLAEQTALGTVMTDRDDNQIWSFFMGAFARSKELSLGQLDKETIVLVGPNDVAAGMKYVHECIDSEASYMFDPAFQIPNYTKDQLKRAVKHAKIVIGNDYEVALMRDKIQDTRYKIQVGQIWITTLGAKGSVIESEGKTYKILTAKVKIVADPTGAGDAFRAGFLAGYVAGKPLPVCGRMGSVCAAYTVEKYGTQTHKFTLKEFSRRYDQNFSPS